MERRNIDLTPNGLAPLDLIEDRTGEELERNGEQPWCPVHGEPMSLHPSGNFFECRIVGDDDAPASRCNATIPALTAAARDARRRTQAELKLLPDAHLMRRYMQERREAIGELPGEVRITLTGEQLFYLHALAMVGLLHQQSTGPAAKEVESMLRKIEPIFSPPVLREVIRRGWATHSLRHPPPVAPLKLYVPRDGE